MSEEYRQLMRIVWIKWKQQAGKPRVCVGYLAGAVGALLVALRYSGFSSGFGVQPMEPWVLMTNYWGDVLMLTLCFLTAVSDAPFVDSLSQTLMLRGRDKRLWNRSMIIYMLLHSVLYWTVILAVSGIPSLFVRHSFSNEWSRTMKILINVTPPNALTEYRLNFFSQQLLTDRTVLEAALSAFGLMILFSYVLALFIYLLNLKTGKPFGSFGSLLILLYSVLIIRNGGANGIPYESSLMAHAIMDSHNRGQMKLSVSILLFLVCLALLTALIRKIASACDYREVNGNRLW